MIRLYPKEVYGLSSHLAEKQRSKDAHPMEGKESGESLILTGSNATAGPIPVYGRVGDRTHKGLYSDERL